ncbi:MAG: GIY-YIG nuclease family protein [bacterium]|nr:GIY-YIG nuclease family protein [bacterium]
MVKPKHIPTISGVYFFKNRERPIYIGKAGNLKKRLASYWRRDAPPKTQQLVREAVSLSWQETDSEIEALILEAKLIKQHRPKYNILMRDDKNYFYVGITQEIFPRIFVTHQPNIKSLLRITNKNELRIRNSSTFVIRSNYIGPFTGGSALKTTLRLLRRIFPYCTCKAPHKRLCLNAEIGRCLGYCCALDANRQSQNAKRAEYLYNIKNIVAILQGKKQTLLKELKKTMCEASRKQEYERAALLRNQIAGLEDVFAHKKTLELPRAKTNWPALQQKLRILLGMTKPIERIEGYDISNISGTDATGSMVVFTGGKPDKKEYRTFKIKTVRGANDPAMIKEVIARRLQHPEWQYPDLIVIDGGKAQLRAALSQLTTYNLQLTTHLTALAKREEELYTEKRRMPIPLKTLDRDILHLFQAVRDEAHRFAKKYHHVLRRKTVQS